MGFLKVSHEAKISTNIGKVNPNSTGKVWENIEIIQTFKNYEIQQKSIKFPNHTKIVLP